jgi:purine-cytosine permease-like protein
MGKVTARFVHRPGKGSAVSIQRSRFKNVGDLKKRTALVIAVLCICLLLVITVGFSFSDSIGNYANDL